VCASGKALLGTSTSNQADRVLSIEEEILAAEGGGEWGVRSNDRPATQAPEVCMRRCGGFSAAAADPHIQQRHSPIHPDKQVRQTNSTSEPHARNDAQTTPSCGNDGHMPSSKLQTPQANTHGSKRMMLPLVSDTCSQQGRAMCEALSQCKEHTTAFITGPGGNNDTRPASSMPATGSNVPLGRPPLLPLPTSAAAPQPPPVPPHKIN
jgi:hypothetical protein